MLPAAPGQVAQGREGVGNAKDGNGQVQGPRGDHRPAPRRDGRVDEVVAVEAVALQRHEHVAGTKGAGVGGDASVALRRIAVAEPERPPKLGVAPGERRSAHGPSSRASSSPTIARSSKGSCSSPTSW